jgi:hypothetical protein
MLVCCRYGLCVGSTECDIACITDGAAADSGWLHIRADKHSGRRNNWADTLGRCVASCVDGNADASVR